MRSQAVTQYQATLAAHYDALETGVIPPLASFVDGVIADVEGDYWPASGTFDDAAWDRAEADWEARHARYVALQQADLRDCLHCGTPTPNLEDVGPVVIGVCDPCAEKGDDA